MLANPKVTIVIPTGPPKAYAFPFVVASLRDMDYDNFDVVFAFTNLEGNSGAERGYLVNQLNAQPTDFKWNIIDTKLTKAMAATPYLPIVMNRRALRNWFLDNGGDYMFMVGGDNPPTRNAINRLLKLQVDCALGISYQRPGADVITGGVYPMMWKPIYHPREVFDKHPELEPINRQQITKAYFRANFLEPVYSDEEWMKKDRIDSVTGGDGNCLYSRRVLETIGWTYPSDYYVSEDIQFFNTALLLGFTTACDPKYHVPHHIEKGGCV
jgi:hypothetical protein